MLLLVILVQEFPLGQIKFNLNLRYWEASLFQQHWYCSRLSTGIWKITRAFKSHVCSASVPTAGLASLSGGAITATEQKSDGNVIVSTPLILEGGKHYKFNKAKSTDVFGCFWR